MEICEVLLFIIMELITTKYEKQEYMIAKYGKTENTKCTLVDLGNSIFKPYGNYCRVTFQHTGQLGKFGIFLKSGLLRVCQKSRNLTE